LAAETTALGIHARTSSSFFALAPQRHRTARTVLLARSGHRRGALCRFAEWMPWAQIPVRYRVVGNRMPQGRRPAVRVHL